MAAEGPFSPQGVGRRDRDLLKRLDMKVDFAAVDFGTLSLGGCKNRLPPRRLADVYFWRFGVDYADPTAGCLRQRQ